MKEDAEQVAADNSSHERLIAGRFEGRGFRREEDKFDKGTNSKQNNGAAVEIQST